LHVLTVATTGSDMGHTSGSTGRLEQQQQQYTGTEDEALEEGDEQEAVAEVRVLLCTAHLSAY
jgi:hypothetical protein